MINAKTLPAFLIGHPIHHSKSPEMQNTAFQARGINAVYLAMDVSSENFNPVMSAFKKIELIGLNITVPYKLDIIKFLDALSNEADQIKAVNTVEIIDGEWIGHNTDWYGVYQTLADNKVPDKGLNALIIGAGGATAGVIYGLLKYGINYITITNRTLHKAEKLAEQFSLHLTPMNQLKANLKNFNLIINCTTLEFNTFIEHFDPETIYFDLKYYTGGIKTKRFIDGSRMLLYQGAKSFSIWTKQEAPLEVMKKSLKTHWD